MTCDYCGRPLDDCLSDACDDRLDDYAAEYGDAT